MQAVVCRNVEDCSVEDVPEPNLPGPEWVKIRVESVGLCGSDIYKLLYSWPPDRYLGTPILGHEIAGVVVETGHKVRQVKVGERVAVEPLLPCQRCDYCKAGNYQLCPNLKSIGRDLPGGFAQFVCVRQDQLHLLPQTMSFPEGALIDPVAVVVHCMHLLELNNRSGFSVAIVGDGPIGLLSVQVARVFGADNIVLFGKHEYRANLALKFGADQIILSGPENHKISSFSGGFDVAIEAVGGKQSVTLQSCIDLVSPGGLIGVLGVFDFEFLGVIPFRHAFYKEVKILGSNSYSIWNGEREFELGLRLVRDSLVDVKSLITHQLPLSEFRKAMEIMKHKTETRAIKIIFQP